MTDTQSKFQERIIASTKDDSVRLCCLDAGKHVSAYIQTRLPGTNDYVSNIMSLEADGYVESAALDALLDQVESRLKTLRVVRDMIRDTRLLNTVNEQ